MLRRLSCSITAFLTLFLAACGGGGGGSAGGGGGGGVSPPPPPPPITKNLSATDFQVRTLDPRIGYPLLGTITIDTNEASDNVSVSVFAIEKNDDPNAEIRQFPLGSQTIERVEAGSSAHDIEVNIPSSVELPGVYHIAVVVDPVGEIEEIDEEDNTASVETSVGPPDPNILLEEVALDRVVLEIDTAKFDEQVTGAAGNVHNADAAGTITVGVDGLEIDEIIELEAFAKLRIARSDAGTSHDVPLYLWNSDAQRYMSAYGIDPNGMFLAAEEWLPVGEFAPQLVEDVADEAGLDDLNRDSVFMNFYFPGRLGEELENSMRFPRSPGDPGTLNNDPTIPPPDLTAQAIDALRSFLVFLPSNGTTDGSAAMAVLDFEICVQIRPADPTIVDRDPMDNEMCSPIGILLPPQKGGPRPLPDLGGYLPEHCPALPAPCIPTDPLSSGDGFDTKGGGSAFGFLIDFGAFANGDYRGYSQEVRGINRVTIFGIDVDYYSLTVTALLSPDYNGNTESTNFRVELRHLGLILDSDVVDVDLLAFAPTEIALNKTYSKEAPDPAKEYTAFVGPIPVIGGASIVGNLGVDYRFMFGETNVADTYRLGHSIEPFVNVEAGIYAGVGNPLFAVGVEGILELFDERVIIAGGADIEVVNDGYVGGIAELIITEDLKITNVFTGPIGVLNLFARYTVPGFRTCSWGFFTGICPTLKTIKAIKNIWRSKALFRFSDVLYEEPNDVLDMIMIQGEEPVYFEPTL